MGNSGTEPDVFGATVDQLVAVHGIAVHRVARKKGKGASAARSTIRVGKKMLDRPAEFQAWSAAHEVAHIACSHRVGTPAAVVLIFAAAAAVGAAGTVWFMVERAARISLAMFLSVPLLLIAGAALYIGAGVLSGRWARRQEREADQLAQEWGYPLTPAVVKQIRADESRITRWLIFRPLREHPLPEHRISSRV